MSCTAALTPSDVGACCAADNASAALSDASARFSAPVAMSCPLPIQRPVWRTGPRVDRCIVSSTDRTESSLWRP